LNLKRVLWVARGGGWR